MKLTCEKPHLDMRGTDRRNHAQGTLARHAKLLVDKLPFLSNASKAGAIAAAAATIFLVQPPGKPSAQSSPGIASYIDSIDTENCFQMSHSEIDKRLVRAVEKKDADSVKIALDQEADPNTPDRNMEPVLVIACRNRDTATATLLLKSGADINTEKKPKGCGNEEGGIRLFGIRNENRMPPLLEALEGGDSAMAAFLLRKKANIYRWSDAYGDALTSAALSGDLGTFRLMLSTELGRSIHRIKKAIFRVNDMKKHLEYKKENLAISWTIDDDRYGDYLNKVLVILNRQLKKEDAGMKTDAQTAVEAQKHTGPQKQDKK